MWRETTKHKRNLKIFNEELDGFVPDRILDFHVHIWNEGVSPAGKEFPIGDPPVSKYDIEDLEQDLSEIYPGRKTAAVCFGIPIPSYDKERNDQYVATVCDRKRFFGLRLFDPYENDREMVEKELSDGSFVGIKPYLDYVRKENRDDVVIPEMLPSWIMEIANRLGLIVMLHIPRKERLADPLNQRHLVELCECYPNVKFVLAHVGRAFYLRNVLGNLDRLKGFPNLYVDVSMLNHWEVLEHLFQNVPAERIVYGTDTPLALTGGKSIEINHQYTYVTSKPWPLSISDDHGKLVFTSFIYEEIRALKHAVERLGLNREFVEDLFYNNGMSLLRSVCSGG
jgi:glutamate-1-semialdehyde 2,1-aminomutase